MSNPFYEAIGRGSQQNNFVNQFMAFKRSFNGNPQEVIRQLMSSGKVSQEQYDAAVAKAKQLQQLIQR